MTIEEKAIEIADSNYVEYEDYRTSREECINSAVDMAEWIIRQAERILCSVCEDRQKCSEQCSFRKNFMKELKFDE